jgi:hypothetical protein
MRILRPAGAAAPDDALPPRGSETDLLEEPLRVGSPALLCSVEKLGRARERVRLPSDQKIIAEGFWV